MSKKEILYQIEKIKIRRNDAERVFNNVLNDLDNLLGQWYIKLNEVINNEKRN